MHALLRLNLKVAGGTVVHAFNALGRAAQAL
jgi:hypothetical protein